MVSRRRFSYGRGVVDGGNARKGPGYMGYAGSRVGGWMHESCEEDGARMNTLTGFGWALGIWSSQFGAYAFGRTMMGTCEQPPARAQMQITFWVSLSAMIEPGRSVVSVWSLIYGIQ